MKKLLFGLILSFLGLFFLGLWLVGWIYTKPVNQEIGNCPKDLICENVEFLSQSKANIKGWFVEGKKGKGVVILMHGVGASRLATIDRIGFLNKSGFSVLSFDFQAHGESIGDQITFGFLESRDSDAAIEFVKKKLPDEKVGVIGISMGGAAFLLSKNKAEADAVVLEMVYSTMQVALENRLNMWLFDGAEIFTPLLSYQFKPRFGFSIDDLRPIDKIKQIKSPVLFIVGEKDLHASLPESKEFLDEANEPKDLWVVPNAAHQDLHQLVPNDYEKKVLDFFTVNLSGN